MARRDNEWFTLKLHVQGPRVRIRVNGTRAQPVRLSRARGRRRRPDAAGCTKIGKGTLALQCHDGKSQVRSRRIAVHPLPGRGPVRPRAPRTPIRRSPARYRLARDNFPLVDLRALDVKDGRYASRPPSPRRVAAPCSSASRAAAGRARGIKGDAGIDDLVRRFGGKPLFLGLRADERGWAKTMLAEGAGEARFRAVRRQERLRHR